MRALAYGSVLLVAHVGGLIARTVILQSGNLSAGGGAMTAFTIVNIVVAGISLAGACPGTTLAQIGVGYRDALFTLFGGLCGAVAFTYAQPWLDKALIGTAPKVIFTDLLGIPYWQGALGLAAAIVVVLFVMEKLRSWRADLGSDVDGVTSASPAPPAPGSAATSSARPART